MLGNVHYIVLYNDKHYWDVQGQEIVKLDPSKEWSVI